jgi:hypothetical protein
MKSRSTNRKEETPQQDPSLTLLQITAMVAQNPITWLRQAVAILEAAEMQEVAEISSKVTADRS